MSNYYETHTLEFIDKTLGIDMTRLYRPFIDNLPTGTIPHILDAACGSGRDTMYFLSRGYKVTAFDASSSMANQAQKLIDHPVLHMTFDDINWESHFDGIWTCACLLHIHKDDIKATLQKIITALKPDGIWYMSFKEGFGEEIEENTGRMFNSYTIDNLSELLEGFPEINIIKTWTEESKVPGNEGTNWVNAIVRKI